MYQARPDVSVICLQNLYQRRDYVGAQFFPETFSVFLWAVDLYIKLHNMSYQGCKEWSPTIVLFGYWRCQFRKDLNKEAKVAGGRFTATMQLCKLRTQIFWRR